ncbi:TRAP transporter substrate-binding protein [Hominifimenecus sp. rT4P-3]|uniref:TRAP transporter substrate-binding protein n=1 Tax=Hominifimenecus sp. rT4P-3 TaxID=3242979 RepID=UPI003DA47BE7
MKRKSLWMVSAILSAALLTACGGSGTADTTKAPTASETQAEAATQAGTDGQTQAGEDPYADLPEMTIHIANTAPDKASLNVHSLAFEEALERITGGKIQVEVHANSTMGSDRESAEAVQLGELNIIAVTAAPMMGFVPEAAVLDMPMVYTGYDMETIQKVFDGEWGDKMRAAFEEKGFKLLDVFTGDAYRQLATNKKIESADDVKGLRIRVMENVYHMDFWQQAGAAPTPMAFGEVYLALQQGLLDAHENPLEVIYFSGIYEQQKYLYTNANTTLFSVTFSMNLEQYNALPDAYKQAFDEALAEARAKSVESYQNNMKEMRVLMEESGMEFLELDSSVVSFLQESAKNSYQMLADEIGSEWLDSLFAALDAAK